MKTWNGIIQSGNGIIQSGNGIISPNSRPPIKTGILQNVCTFYQQFQNFFWKQEMKLSKLVSLSVVKVTKQDVLSVS